MNAVEITHKGVVYKASFVVEDGLVTVHCPFYGEESTQLGGSPPQTIARFLLSSIIEKADADGLL